MDQQDLQRKRLQALMKANRTKKIKKVFREIRKTVMVENELQLIIIRDLWVREKRAIAQNSDEAVNQVKRYAELRKLGIYEIPLIGKKLHTVNGKMCLSPI